MRQTRGIGINFDGELNTADALRRLSACAIDVSKNQTTAGIYNHRPMQHPQPLTRFSRFESVQAPTRLAIRATA